jgi:transposase
MSYDLSDYEWTAIKPILPTRRCYNRFVLWWQDGVWDQIVYALAAGPVAATIWRSPHQPTFGYSLMSQASHLVGLTLPTKISKYPTKWQLAVDGVEPGKDCITAE